MAVKVSVSPTGAGFGGLVGAIIRPAILVPPLWQHLDGEQRLFVLMVSVGIGFAIGALAGLIGKPVISALVGGALAITAYFVTIWPMMACMCFLIVERGVTEEPPHYGWVGLTGVLSGAAGGLAEYLSTRKDVAASPEQDTGEPRS